MSSDGFGDYIIMNIDPEGKIQNWKKLDILKLFDVD